VLHLLTELDEFAIEATHTIRWEPLTILFVLASAWWVKWPLIAALGALGDARPRCASARTCALAASIAAGVAAATVALVKEVTDRARPPVAEASIQPLVSLPESTSFPSGHAATAFAAATAVALVYPRLRVPVLLIAALVALSRVYLGVHYWSDVVVGSLVGVGIGWVTVVAMRWVVRALRARARSRGARGTSSARLRRSPG
jgi:membrane-associated phospholipid phosphatase